MKILLFLLLMSSTSFAGTINVVTGYGYLTDSNGNVVSKLEFLPGQHTIADGYTYTEVVNQSALDAVQSYQAPETPEQLQEDLNNQALQAVIADKIASDSALSSKQATITSSISAQKVKLQ